MNDPQKIKILVVDDHPIVRAGLCSMISYQKDFDLIGEATDAFEAVQLFERYLPDVTLVDLSLPDLSGIELIAMLRNKSPTARFLVLTANVGGAEISNALQAGAHAYLFKSAPYEELLGAIRTVSRGGRYLSPAVGRKADESIAHPALTHRELEVLQWLARGYSYLQIAREMGVTKDTIKFHVGNILGKLGVMSRSKAVVLSQKLGLIQSRNY